MSARIRRRLGATVVVALLASLLPATVAVGDTTDPNALWANEIPAGSPYPRSTEYSGIRFTGRYKNYGAADTWYPSWGADDKLYSPFMDGFCLFAGSAGFNDPAVLGHTVITGSDPMNLSFTCGTHTAPRAPFDGRYASASLHHNGVWYYGSYTLNQAPRPGASACGNYCTLGPFVGFDTSTDGGATWTPTPRTPSSPLFGESIANGNRVKLGALHTVDFGRNMVNSPDGKAYFVGNGGGGSTSESTFVGSDNIYLVRVTPSPQTINNPGSYEYYAGTNSSGQPVWSSSFSAMRPLLTWNRQLGNVSITYNAPLRRYMMAVSRPRDGVDTTGRYDTYLMMASSITGPYQMVHYLGEFGTQAYFPAIPSKFISADGRTMWLVYSANYAGSQKEIPVGSQYNMVMREFTLDTGGDTKLEAEHAALSGGASFNDAYSGYSGTGHVAGYWNLGASTTFTVNVRTAGARDVTLRYANGPDGGTGPSPLGVYVNGVRVGQTTLADTGSWSTWAEKTETLTLRAGSNTISYRYESGDGCCVNLDFIRYRW